MIADAGPLIHLDELQTLWLKTLAIDTHGTLGLLVRAIRRRQLSGARVLELLQQIPEHSSLHIRPGLLAKTIQQVASTLKAE